MSSTEDPEIKKIFSKIFVIDELKRCSIEEILASPIFLNFN